MSISATEMVKQSGVGRTFESQRRVRLGDVSPGGRLRLDAAARYLQDVSDDDTRDAGLDAELTPAEAGAWVVRRTTLDVIQFPMYLDVVSLQTWCSGTGGRWAERRTDIATTDGGLIRASTLWIYLDPVSRRPTTLTAQFVNLFASAANGRIVSSRQSLPAPPTTGDEQSWLPRFVDFDVMGHVNNAVYWSEVEQSLSIDRALRAPLRATVEYGPGIGRDDSVGLLRSAGMLWWTVNGKSVAAASIEPIEPIEPIDLTI